MIQLFDKQGHKIDKIEFPEIANDQYSRLEFKIKNTDSEPHIIDYEIDDPDVTLSNPPNLLQAGQTEELIMFLIPLYKIEKALNSIMKIRVT